MGTASLTAGGSQILIGYVNGLPIYVPLGMGRNVTITLDADLLNSTAKK